MPERFRLDPLEGVVGVAANDSDANDDSAPFLVSPASLLFACLGVDNA
jgi:hypothetical protein